MNRTISFILFCLTYGHSVGQTTLYNIDSIPEIRFYFEETNWDEILDQFYVNGDEERLLCSLTIDGTLIDSVGIRYKGFSSVSVDRIKNPFNIKLDYLIEGQDYQGKEKIKLSNVIQDPSFLRETLSYEIANKYMPSSKANYANLYINDTLWGLYTNVESINKDFVFDRFQTRHFPLFKCNPNSLDLEGENSNLNNVYGEYETAYHELYDMKSEQGWSELVELMVELNENPENIESILNVDRALWMHAFNYALINFDSYIGYAQNYYLYQDHNGQFNPILWDMNMSFGSYRFSDASEYYDGFSIEQAKTVNPLSHVESVSVLPRPLMRKLFENETYKKMYMAHLKTIIEENFANGDYYSRALEMQNLIQAHVYADENKFYGDIDFDENIDSSVSDLIEYPGISDLMEGRVEYMQSYPGYNEEPSINNINTEYPTITSGTPFSVQCEVLDGDEVYLFYRYDSFGLFSQVEMLDNGVSGDESNNDNIYGYVLENPGNHLEYYIYAQNTNAGVFEPRRAAYELNTINGNPVNNEELVINELLASNQSVVQDEEGLFEDWVELYNNTDKPLSTVGLYLSDDSSDLLRWECPNTVIEPFGYRVFWLDDDENDGFNHGNFDINSQGESLYLSREDLTVIDSVSFDIQQTDLAFGRFPNGTGDFVEIAPTYNAENGVVGISESHKNSEFKIYPNPVKNFLIIESKDPMVAFNIVDMLGNRILTNQNLNDQQNQMIDLSLLSAGYYLIHVEYPNHSSNQKFIKL